MPAVIDAVVCEPQFLDHMAPVWRLLQPPYRGRLLVEQALAARAHDLGLDPTPIDSEQVRRSARDPGPQPGPGPQALVVSIGDTKVARRLGYRRFAVMEHGVGQAYGGARGLGARHPSYSGGVDRGDAELVLVPNEYAAGLWRAGYPDLDVQGVGSPHLEALPRREPSSTWPVVAVSFHWPAFVAPEAGTALGHYRRVLPDLVKAYQVIGHAHPKGDWPQRMQRVFRRAGITDFVADFADVCRQADLYVCDNSSTIFEFAATGRPVVVLNGPDYRRHVNHGLRFWEAATVGIQVDQPEQLLPAVAQALLDPPAAQAARQAALQLVYAYQEGAAQRAATAIALWAQGARQAVA